MKKTLLFIAGAMLLTTGINAQITLSLSSYTSSPIGTDSFKTTLAATSYPSFAPGTNVTWNVSTVTDSPANILVYNVASSALSSTFADSSGYSLGSYAYQGNLLTAITGSGIMQYGFSTPGAAYSLTSVTTGLTDSLWIPSQVDAYSSAVSIIKFPASTTNSWSTSYVDTIDFTLSVAALTYSHALGYITSNVIRKDTVIGWGQAIVKTDAGIASGPMNVLQVRTMTTTTNYYYVNGTLLSGAALLALNLTQGQVTNTYEQNFYRVNEVSPLVNVQFSDSANTTPTKVTTHEQRLAVGESVANLFNSASVKIYPNPVTGHSISIDVSATNGEWKYELVNMAGQTVAADILPLSNNQTHTQINLANSLIAGIYNIRLINDGKQVVVRSLEIN